MNLNNYKNRHDLLIDWILETVPKGSRILDIGANDGSFCPEVARIATHAAFFAPAKYGIMPEILQPQVLSRGNGILESTTFLAAILGLQRLPCRVRLPVIVPVFFGGPS